MKTNGITLAAVATAAIFAQALSAQVPSVWTMTLTGRATSFAMQRLLVAVLLIAAFARDGSSAQLDGRVLFSVGKPVRSPPAVGADGMLYFCADDWKLYAIDSNITAKRWEFSVDPGSSPVPVIGLNGTVYVSAGMSRHKMYALDGKAGRKLWEFNADWVIESAAAVDGNGNVYFGRVGVWEPSGRYYGRIYGLNGKDGSQLWNVTVPNSVTDSPVMDLGGTLFIGNKALDSETGATKWTLTPGRTSRADQTPALGTTGLVYAKNLVVAADVDSPAIGADGTAYCGNRSIVYVEGKGFGAFFYAVEGSTARLRWKAFFPSGLSHGQQADSSAHQQSDQTGLSMLGLMLALAPESFMHWMVALDRSWGNL